MPPSEDTNVSPTEEDDIFSVEELMVEETPQGRGEDVIVEGSELKEFLDNMD